MPTRNVNLTEHFNRFVNELVDAGKFTNASEVMRAGLRLLENQSRTEEQQLAALKQLVAEGLSELDQGLGLTFNNEKELTAGIARIGRRAAKAAGRRASG